MNDINSIITLLESLKEKTVKSEATFSSLGSDLFIDLFFAGFGEESSIDTDTISEACRRYIYYYTYCGKSGLYKWREWFWDTTFTLFEIFKESDSKDNNCLQKINDFFDNCDSSINEFNKSICVTGNNGDTLFLDEMITLRKGLLPYSEEDSSAAGVKHTRISVSELFMQQNNNISELDYLRLDIVIKYLAIENYYGLNEDGFELYSKLQAGITAENEQYQGIFSDISTAVYKELIESFEKGGYDLSSEITCDKNLRLLDGAHRMALCMYHNVPMVSIQVLNLEKNIVPFNVERLLSVGFTDADIKRVTDKANELFNQYRHTITCIIWPPAVLYFDAIEKEIRETICNVVSSNDYLYSEETFPRIVKGIYHIDDIDDWKIDRKLEAMAPYAMKKIRVLELDINSPLFRLKDANNKTISVLGEELKRHFRSKYMKCIPNYIYDIIIHTADNFHQAQYLKQLFTPCINLREYLDSISGFEYVLAKHDTPYTPADFPDSYAFSKDIDVICSHDQLDDLVLHTKDYILCMEHTCDIRQIYHDEHYLFRFELNGYLLFQIDIGCSITGLVDSFWSKVFNDRVKKDNYYIPCVKDELCIRLNEYINKPSKLHHINYIENHITEYNQDDIQKYLTYQIP